MNQFKNKKVKKLLLLASVWTVVAGKAQNSHVLGCFLEEGTASIYEKTKTGFVPVDSGRIFCGSIASPKEKEGDFRSPLGVYHVSKPIPYHGSYALPIEFPNAMDREAGRTGSGFLIHIGPSSEGCTSTIGEEFQEVVQKKVSEGEIWSFPSRMTAAKTAAWKLAWGSSHYELIDTLAARYALLEGTDMSVPEPLSVQIEWAKDVESFGIDTAIAGVPLSTVMGKILFPDSSTLIQFSDKTGETTRFAQVQQWFTAAVVPFEKVTIMSGTRTVAEIGRIKSGYVVTADAGTAEGNMALAVCRATESSPPTPVTVVYLDDQRYVCSDNSLPFKTAPSRLYPDGIVVVADVNAETVTFVVMGQAKVYRRCSGELGLFRQL